MKPIRNSFLVEVDTVSPYVLNIIGLDGKPLQLRPDFNELYHTNYCGVVKETPMEFHESVRDEKNIKVGDKIYFQYDVALKKNAVQSGELSLFCIDYKVVYAKEVEGKIQPLGDRILIKKLEQPKEKFDVNTKNYPQLAECISVSDYAESLGIKAGSILFIMPNSGAEIGKTGIYWLPVSLVQAYKKEESIYPMNDRAVILEDEVSQALVNGVLVHSDLASNFKTGKVLESNIGYKGDNVTFIHAMNTKLSFEGKKYCLAKERNLIFKNKN